MAIDTLARGIAVSNSGGGGGGSLDVGIEEGTGIKITGDDPKKISNDGVTNVTESAESAANGTVKVVFGNKTGDAATKHVAVKGLNNAAYMDKTTTIAAKETAVDTKLPTEKAVRTELDKKMNANIAGTANGLATLDANAKLTSTQLPDHNHASSKINAMTGYAKGSVASEVAIKETDTLNQAIAKLENGLGTKQASGTYATGNSSGDALKAVALNNTSAIGSGTQGVYIGSDGKPKAMTYTLGQSVAADAKLTDTTYTAGTGINISDAHAIKNTGVLAVENSPSVDPKTGETVANGTFQVNTNGTVSYVGIKGLAASAFKGVDTAVTSGSDKLVESGGVYTAINNAIANIPSPMVYRGTVGSGGTIADLPTPRATKTDDYEKNVGWTYKVCYAAKYTVDADGTKQDAKIGDLFISDGTKWNYIPSADDAGGTASEVDITGYQIETSKKAINAATDTVLTALEKLEYKVDNADIPSYSKSDYETHKSEIKSGSLFIIKDDYSDGELSEVVEARTNSTGATPVKYDTLKKRLDGEYKEIKDTIKELPTPMTYQGTVGTGGDVASLDAITKPVNGMTLKVISQMTVVTSEGSKTAKAGDTVIYNGNTNVKKWDLIPSADEPNTLETVKVNGTALTPDSNKAVNITITTDTANKNGQITVNGSDKVVYDVTKDIEKTIPTSATDTKVLSTKAVKTALENKVDKTTVSAEGIAETTATITVPEKAKAVAVQKMYGKTVKITPESGDPYLANAANESVVSLVPDNTIIRGKYISNNGIFSDDNTRATTKLSEHNGSISYTITSKSNKAVRFSIYEFNSSKTFIKNNGWNTELTGTYTLTDTTKYVSILLRYSGDTEIIEGDLSINWNAGIKHTAEIPISLTSLADYGCSVGDVCNYIDFENGLYYHNVKSIDLSTLKWNYDDASGQTYLSSTVVDSLKMSSNMSNNIWSAYTNAYPNKTTYSSLTSGEYIANAKSRWFNVLDSTISSENAFVDKIKSSLFIYELADSAKEVIDISDIIRPLKVESGGTVTFVNPHNIDCDTVVKYKKEV